MLPPPIIAMRPFAGLAWDDLLRNMRLCQRPEYVKKSHSDKIDDINFHGQMSAKRTFVRDYAITFWIV